MSLNNEPAVDHTELASLLETTPEALQAEDAALTQASLEELLDAIGQQVEPEVPVDDERLMELEPAMESILALAQDIHGSGSISRSDAAALKQMTTSLEGFQDVFQTMPLNSYTELPSKVNFNASMEGIFSSIGRKIVEIIKAIIQWIKDRAKAFVGLFRNNRIKAKQTEEAAKKVDAALKTSKKSMNDFNIDELVAMQREAMQNIDDTIANMAANRKQWDELRAKVGEQNAKPWVNGANARAQSGASSLQLDLPMLAAALAYGARSGNAKKATDYLKQLADHTASSAWEASRPDVSPLMVTAIVELDNCLFESSTVSRPEAEIESCAKALREIAARLSKEAADVDILTVKDPEMEMSKLLAAFTAARLTATADSIGSLSVKASNYGSQRCAALETEIAKATRAGETVAENDPRVSEARRIKVIIKALDDIDAIYRAIGGAFAKATAIGADLAKNPARAKAA